MKDPQNEPQRHPQPRSPRVITIAGEIGWGDVDVVAAQLAKLNEESEEPITVQITSPGGNLVCGLAIHDLLTTNRSPIFTAAFGGIASAASIVFQAGGVRLMSPNARIKIHCGRMKLDGMYGRNELIGAAVDVAEADARVDKLMAGRSGRSLREIREWTQAEREFDAEDSVARGLADGVIDPRPVLRRAKPRRDKKSRKGRRRKRS